MAQQPQRIDQLLQAAPVTVGDKVVQPVARLDGWWQDFGVNGAGAVVRLSPASITVREGERSYSVPIVDSTQSTLRTFFFIGSGVALLCLLVMLLTTLLTRRR